MSIRTRRTELDGDYYLEYEVGRTDDEWWVEIRHKKERLLSPDKLIDYEKRLDLYRDDVPNAAAECRAILTGQKQHPLDELLDEVISVAEGI